MHYSAYEAAHDVPLIICYCIIFTFVLYMYFSAMLAIINYVHTLHQMAHSDLHLYMC